jgi:predicted dehydrogenase
MAKASRRVRYAVIGAGNIAQVAVLPAFAHASENSELVALVSDDPEKRAELGKRYKLEHTGGYDDLERVLADSGAQAVYIATPNSLHRAHTERAARAGMHVLCEKPMASSVADCEAMIAVTSARRLKLMIAYRLHFEEGTLSAIDLVQKGKLGQVVLFSSVFSHQVRPGDIRTRLDLGGGGLFDLGVYPINAARSLFADEPNEVIALVPPIQDARFQGVDETTSVLLRFPLGEIAQLTVSQGAASVSNYRVVGSEGDLRVEPAFEYVDAIKHYLTIDGKTHETTFDRSDQFAPELIYFSRCILDDLEPEPSGEEGLADVRVVEAALESARTGKAVKLSPFLRSARPGLSQVIKKPPVREQKTVNAPSPSK